MKLLLTGDGEIGLVRSNLPEDALSTISDFGYRGYIYYTPYFDNGCVFSTKDPGIQVTTNGVKSLVPLQKHGNNTLLSNRGKRGELELEVDHAGKKVTWKLTGCECTTSLPGEGPIYVVYCTGSKFSSAEFI